MRFWNFRLLASLIVCSFSVNPVSAQHGAVEGEWRSYGGDLGATKYSPLNQITAENFEALKLA